MLTNVSLTFEYEATCMRPEHIAASGLSLEDVDAYVTAIIALLEPVKSHFVWRPQLRDPGDELVLDAAINGHADAIVTFNDRDFGLAPRSFGIEIFSPKQVLRRLTS
jgi:predicted nucleic acid-binding protein